MKDLIRDVTWKEWLFFTVTALLMVTVQACGQMNSRPAFKFISEVNYFWEPKAGLCFAAVNSRTQNMFYVTSIAHVPNSACGKDEEGR